MLHSRSKAGAQHLAINAETERSSGGRLTAYKVLDFLLVAGIAVSLVSTLFGKLQDEIKSMSADGKRRHEEVMVASHDYVEREPHMEKHVAIEKRMDDYYKRNSKHLLQSIWMLCDVKSPLNGLKQWKLSLMTSSKKLRQAAVMAV